MLNNIEATAMHVILQKKSISKFPKLTLQTYFVT